ncbi:MAG: molybdenum cofactor biosynthesis protein MoaE [Phycisphaerae bacterium]
MEAVNDQRILVELVNEPIRVDRVLGFVTGDPTLGAIVTFEGATRRDEDPKHGPIVRLDYEAYEGMARRQLERLAVAAKKRWSAGRVTIVHRLGAVLPGEVSVMIAVACGHRTESFEACRWLIDTLKKEVPIWKKDVFEDGHVRWVQPGHPVCGTGL